MSEGYLDFPPVNLHHYPVDGHEGHLLNVAFGLGSPAVLLEASSETEAFELTASLAGEGEDPYAHIAFFMLIGATAVAEMLPEDARIKIQEAMVAVGELLEGEDA